MVEESPDLQIRQSVLALSEIHTSLGTHPRAGVDGVVVASYAAQMVAGAKFPPIVVFYDGTSYILADGFHRLFAAQRVGLVAIEAEIRRGTSKDALWYAVGAMNRTVSMRLKGREADRFHAVEMVLRTWPDLSSRVIGEHMGWQHRSVARLRQEMSERLNLPGTVRGKDGSLYPARQLKKPRAVDEHPHYQLVADLLKAGTPSGEVANIAHVRWSYVAAVRRHLGLGTKLKTADAVDERRREVLRLAGEGWASRQIAETMELTAEHVRKILKTARVNSVGDKAISGTKKFDSNRVLERLSMDATMLLEGVDLIDYSKLDKGRVPEWLDTLKDARRQLLVFIRRLTKETGNEGEA